MSFVLLPYKEGNNQPIILPNGDVVANHWMLSNIIEPEDVQQLYIESECSKCGGVKEYNLPLTGHKCTCDCTKGKTLRLYIGSKCGDCNRTGKRTCKVCEEGGEPILGVCPHCDSQEGGLVIVSSWCDCKGSGTIQRHKEIIELMQVEKPELPNEHEPDLETANSRFEYEQAEYDDAQSKLDSLLKEAV